MSTATLTLDMSRFNAAMADLLTAQGVKFGNGTGEEGRKFLVRQTTMLVETLIKITPPLNMTETEKAIADRITAKFNFTGQMSNDLDKKPERLLEMGAGDQSYSGSGVKWYAWGKDYIYGITKEADMTNASVDELKRMLYKRTSTGLIHGGNRGRQRVRIWQKVTVRASTLAKLISRMKSHVGRQKAGWLPAWNKLVAMGGATVSTRTPSPKIARHTSGARGDFREELQRPGAPSITLINSAVGIGKATEQINAALNVRVKAMGRDMILYLKGIKQKHGIG